MRYSSGGLVSYRAQFSVTHYGGPLPTGLTEESVWASSSVLNRILAESGPGGGAVSSSDRRGYPAKETPMGFGIGTIVVIVIIVLAVMFLRRH